MTSRIFAFGCILQEIGAITMNYNERSSKIFPEAKHTVSKDHFQYKFSSAIEPVIRIDPGELVHVETNDCFHGKLTPISLSLWEEERRKHSEEKEYQKFAENENQDETRTKSGGGSFLNESILDNLPRSQRNPVTGPIYINGAEPGDLLAVTLVDIRPRGVGIACCGGACGQLSSWMKPDSTTIKFFDISSCGNLVTMREFVSADNQSGVVQNLQPYRGRLGPISFHSSPMLGTIGVAPGPTCDPIGTMPAGEHGGNLDNNANGIGSTIYFRVNHSGALLSLGDMHASQGDGEISGTGIEVSGDILLRCEVLKENDVYGSDCFSNIEDDDVKNCVGDWKLEYPLTETDTHWITHGVVECNIPETTSIACKEAAKILSGQWGFSLEESFLFLSTKGNLGICQACHPDIGTQIAKMTVPKLENLCPRPFRMQISSCEKSN